MARILLKSIEFQANHYLKSKTIYLYKNTDITIVKVLNFIKFILEYNITANI
jgi:hypothetical protein